MSLTVSIICVVVDLSACHALPPASRTVSSPSFAMRRAFRLSFGAETRAAVRERLPLLVDDRFVPVARFGVARLVPVAFFFLVRRFADFLVAAIPSSIMGDEVSSERTPGWVTMTPECASAP